ncbi:hypothetical protein ACIQCR_12595 [Streptomyces sp. NPDC093249]|uniref:hypothetical protein n=1 Tax=unclassified Streptomyces TaxID=2593676 RepID=UPI00344E81F3
MQDRLTSGDAASAWLKEHFVGDPAPEVRITWRVDSSEEDPAAVHPLLDLLFGAP